MSPRPRLTIPFGGGLDRKSGHAFVDGSSMGDLRNVHLYKGRMELRRGLARMLDLEWGDSIVGIFPIRKQGLAAVAVFDELTRDVRLYAIDGTLSTKSLIGTLWTVPADASTRVLAADVYDNLVLAHDEESIGRRQVTRIYSLFTGGLIDLELDLARGGTPQPVKFRGVAKHLNYLLGWGYGTADDPDRPETLRISVRGLATDSVDWFVPEHYFLVGTQGDPIVGGESVGTIFALGKRDEVYRLVGYDRANFDVIPVDPAFGYLTSRSHVTVSNSKHYYWSLNGPRVTEGDGSTDLELPLDLGGPDPDPIISALEATDGCAYYDPDQGEVVFIFDDWAYVLHLKDSAPRWSYREYGAIVSCVGLVYEGGAADLTIAEALLTSVTYNDPTYVGADVEPLATVVWSLSEAPGVADRVEVWVKARFGTDTWSKLGDELASALTLQITLPRFWTFHDIAIRVTSGGLAGAGYTGSPDTWPPASQDSVISQGEVLTYTLGEWSRISATQMQVDNAYAGPGMNGTAAAHDELSFANEQSDDAGMSFGAVSGGGAYDPVLHPNADAGSTFRYGVTITGPDGVSATAFTADGYIGPANITGVILDPPSFGGYPHDHDFEWADGPAGGYVIAVGGHVHGTYEETSTTSEEPVENGITTLFNWSTHSLGAPQTSRVRYKVRMEAFGVFDFSEEAIHNAGSS